MSVECVPAKPGGLAKHLSVRVSSCEITSAEYLPALLFNFLKQSEELLMFKPHLEVSCGKPPAPQNTRQYGKSNYYGSKIGYVCR